MFLFHEGIFFVYDFLQNICPEEECSFLSRLFFSWIESLAWKGFRKPLTDEDLYDLRDQDSARQVVVNFDYHWTKTLHRSVEFHLKNLK